MQVRTVWESDTFSSRYPRKLKIINFWRHFWPEICKTAKKIVVPNQGENWCRQSWRHKETIDISCTAQFVTHQDMTTKRFLYIKQVVGRTSSITAMPRSILLVLIWIFNLVFGQHTQTDTKLAFSFFFQTSYGRFCIFSDRCIGRISRKKKQNKKGELPNCWLVHDQHRV